MASPTHLPRVASFRRGSFALQDEPYALSYKGQGALSSLIRRRSTINLQGAQQIDDEEAGGGVWFPSPSPFGPRDDDGDEQRRAGERRLSAIVLMGSQVRSMRLIGKSNPRYRWERYWKTDEQLKCMKRPLREYYERTNYLVQQYLYIDRLLDSSLPHDLLNEYNNMPASAFRGVEVPDTIREEAPTSATSSSNGREPLAAISATGSATGLPKKVKRTPKDIYRPTETTPLFATTDGVVEDEGEGGGSRGPEIP